MKSSDEIRISELRVSCHIGVPEQERAQSQELNLSATMYPVESAEPLNDAIERTVNYYEVSLRMESVAQEKPRKLIETLAEDLAEMILREFAVCAVKIEIEKFILPQARCVSVVISRQLSDI